MILTRQPIREDAMHELALMQAMREQRTFTMLRTDANGKRYGVRYGIPNLPNTGGFWLQ